MSQAESSRYGRVGSNARNESNEVFQFGSNLAYPNGNDSSETCLINQLMENCIVDKERFRNIDVAEAEKQRQSSDRERRQDRYDFRRSGIICLIRWGS